MEAPPWGDGADLKRGFQFAATGELQGVDALDAAAAVAGVSSSSEEEARDGAGQHADGQPPEQTPAELHASGQVNRKIAEEIAKDLPYIRQKLEKQQGALLVFFSGLPAGGAGGAASSAVGGKVKREFGAASPRVPREAATAAASLPRAKTSVFEAFADAATVYFEETIVAEAAAQKSADGGANGIGGGPRKSGTGANRRKSTETGTNGTKPARATFSVTRPMSNVFNVRCFFAGSGGGIGSSSSHATEVAAKSASAAEKPSAWLENGFGPGSSNASSAQLSSLLNSDANSTGASGAGTSGGNLGLSGGDGPCGQLTVLHVDFADRAACSRICDVVAGLQKRKKTQLGFNFDSLDAAAQAAQAASGTSASGGAGVNQQDVNMLSPTKVGAAASDDFGSFGAHDALFGMSSTTALGALGRVAKQTAVPIASPDALHTIDAVMRALVHTAKSS